MKRRNFLKILPAAGVTSFAVNGHAMRPFANSKMARILNSCDGVEDRVLVLVQLKGGNDGINTIIPFNQYDTYANIRPAIAIPENDMINLDTSLGLDDQIGLHPSLSLFKGMYENGDAAFVQGVGYQSMNRSHFKGTDLWMSGGDGTVANNNIPSGWMGRSLQALYPDVLGAPTSQNPDPLGIQIGNPNPVLGFHTQTEHQNLINLSGQDPQGFFSLIQTIGGAAISNVPDSDHGEELAFIMGIEESTSKYGQRISEVFNAGSNYLSTYPNTTANRDNLGGQLKTIARLIKGGCKTKIYLCQLGGFDTHSSQVDGGNPTVGTHSELLLHLSESVKAFHEDLEGLGLADQVLTCTFSEFGRTPKGNGSDGTDHGTLAPMMVFGKNVKSGVYGTNVNLGNLGNDNQLQGMQFDYRQVFTTILQDWLGASEEVLTEAMFSGYQKMPMIDPAYVVSPDCYLPMTVGTHDNYLKKKSLAAFPNPASGYTSLEFEQSGPPFDALISVHSLGGSMVSRTQVYVNQGSNSFLVDLANLPPGPYFVRLENKQNGKAEVAKLNVMR